MYDAESLKSTLYCDVSAETPHGHKSWELIQIMSFDQTGEKLTRLDEFFDSKVYLDMTGQ